MKIRKIDLKKNSGVILKIFEEILALNKVDDKGVQRILTKNPSKEKLIFSKGELLKALKDMMGDGSYILNEKDKRLLKENLRMKKVRSISGITSLTVLTKPYPCPGKCIFCPNDVRMPKSYISSEPGAQRAEDNKFDPYYQTYNRLAAYRSIGHPVDKIELIVLGGTWTSYPKKYQIWFIKRCFDALNDFSESRSKNNVEPTKAENPIEVKDSDEIDGEVFDKTYNDVVSRNLIENTKDENASWKELFSSQKKNETVMCKCIGLVIETRPDEINEKEVVNIRKLGATKVQLGVQSLDNKVLELNKRGHDVKQTKRAFSLLRSAGFKIHGHWMPNLYGSNPNKDKKDYKKLFISRSFRPDELKIYPCSLIGSSELMKYYRTGKWKPYSSDQLLEVLKSVFLNTPRYCRLTRVIRDIPSQEIVVGNKKTNFRQIVEKELDLEEAKVVDIRTREIKGIDVNPKKIVLKKTKYITDNSTEYFLEYTTDDDKIIGFLRLSLPTSKVFIKEIDRSAMIREIHVYGQSLEIGKISKGKAQHLGLGKKLMEEAGKIGSKAGFKKLSVISSVGTREYYRKNGFRDGKLYQSKKI